MASVILTSPPALSRAVNFMLDNDPGEGQFRMAALQSPAGRRLLSACGRSPDDISSIVLVEGTADAPGTSSSTLRGGPRSERRKNPSVINQDSVLSRARRKSLRHYTKSEAVLRIAARLPNGFPLLAMFGMPFPSLIRDSVYDMVADNRYAILGKRNVCRLTDAGFESRFISA
jgi:predicted DCC family thiol-disulfide oxidoreductase YuxK